MYLSNIIVIIVTYVCTFCYMCLLTFVLELKPTELYLNRLVVKKNATNWREIGLELKIPSEVLAIIYANNTSNIQDCCKEMFREWLQGNFEASWKTLDTAIHMVTHDYNPSIKAGKI